MSFESETSNIARPFEYVFDWKGSAALDRETKEDKGNFWNAYNMGEKLNYRYTSFSFVVLIERSSVTGYDGINGGYYSTEVKDLRTEKIVVRAGKRVIDEGFYADLKGKYKYAKIVYAYIFELNAVAKIIVKGSSLSPYIEAKIGQSMAMTRQGKKTLRNGATEYFAPEIVADKSHKFSEEEIIKFKSLAKECALYADRYTQSNNENAPFHNETASFHNEAESFHNEVAPF